MYCSEETSLFSCNREKKGTEKEKGREGKEREKKKKCLPLVYTVVECVPRRDCHTN